MQKDTILRKGWRFHLGDIPTHLPTAKGPAYISSKTERMKFGPAACGYRDVVNDYGHTGELKCENWEPVTLPHDFVIGGPFDQTENQARGYQHYDCGRYRLHFRLPEEAAEKRITLYFEGAATDCTVYLNG